jgi:predicted metal-dependent phosphoesterase TrpH
MGIMAKFDHHVHTSRHSPDSAIKPHELLERAREAGLDGVVITEHDYQWEPKELAELARRGEVMNLFVFSGAEVSAREGHFLVYGLPNLDDAPAGIELKELIEVVKRHDAAIVAAHPFRWDQDFEAIFRAHGAGLDALELVSNNVTPETRAKTERLLARNRVGRTGSSDGHEPEVVGCYFSEFAEEIKSLAQFVAAIRGGKSRPGHCPGALEASGTVD